VKHARGADADEAQAEVRTADGKLTLLIDFTGYSHHNRPLLQTVSQIIATFQDHYPERLGEAYLLWPPLKVKTLWKAVKHLVDPATFKKVVMVKDTAQHAELLRTTFDKRSLERCVGGENDVPFDSQIFLSRPVNGDVYGSEFDAQLGAPKTSFPQAKLAPDVPVKPAEAPNTNAAADGWKWDWSLEGVFGGG